MPHDPKPPPFVGQMFVGANLCCPNCRRDQLTGVRVVEKAASVEFSCEGCGFVGKLEFESSKGSTTTRWTRTFISCEAELFAGLLVDEHG